MHDRIQAVELFRQEVGGEKLIEGWIEGPCAEGADLRGINTLMMDFYDDPAFVRDLFAFNLEMGITFAKAQVQAGVDIIGVGDAAASLVGPAIYREFVWPAEKNLFDALHAMGTRVRLHICGNITPILDQIGTLGVDFVDLDFMVPVHAAREKIGDDQVLAGNIDPVRTLRDGTPDSIIRALEECRHQAGPHYIIAAGCEVPRDTPIENVKAVYEYAQTTGSGA
jgi:MtaA/CmuA family methyltransferase